MTLNRILFVIILALFVGIANARKINVGIIKEHCSQTEQQAIKRQFSNSGISIELISLKDLSQQTIKGLQGIWYHRTDTVPFSLEEINAGKFLKSYVASGGSLFISMEAFPLLNRWDIETTPVQMREDTVIDEGFGRPLGFHAFKGHALFDGLLGGTFTSKQKEDHIVRKYGFFNNTVPQIGKVAGIQWTYITFWENNKILVEYSLGKGKIIAAGAYLYYSPENYQALHLKKFTENVFSYMTKGAGSKNHYWDYNKPAVTPYNFNVTTLLPVKATRWHLPEPTLKLTQRQSSTNFYDLVGRKILWMGKMNSGVEEIWVHPFMALRDFEAGVRMKNEDSVRWLKNIIPSTTVSPEFLIREYTVGSDRVKEVQTVSFDKPLGVVHFEIEGKNIEELVVMYSSNLRYMWPYNNTATESIQYAFSKAINGHIISGQKGQLNTVVVYSDVPDAQSARADTSKLQVNLSGTFKIKDDEAINIYISGSTQNVHEAVSNIAKEKKSIAALYLKSNEYYTNILNNYLVFETPDADFNEGYKWALARTDQFLQTSPGIGTSLMAGFGTTARGWNGRHDISGRPGYAWYFGRDAEWSALAINSYGDFKMVKEVLRSFVRYQDLNGKIYHELTSSGVAHYDASDATPLFIVLAAHYLKYSGDLDLIKELWPAIKKAYNYCKSTDTDGDGLIENTNVGHGWIEGGPLFGSHSELYLVACWAATLDGMSYMSSFLNLKKDADNYAADAEKVRQIINNQFWNKQQDFFYVGKMKDGRFMADVTGYSTVPVYLNTVIDKDKIFKMNERISSKYFSSDWGLRMLEDSAKNYHAGSYHSGMVWPLYSGWAALSQFKTGHNTSAYKHIMNNLQVYKYWALGSIEETLNGSTFKPNGVCHHQCWSETMVLQPAIEGMLGLNPDAMVNRLSLSPYFPWHWHTATVKNIRMNTTLLNMSLKRTENNTVFKIESTGETDLVFEPRFPIGTEISNVTVNGKKINYIAEQLAEGFKLKTEFVLQRGINIIDIQHSGGIGFIPAFTLPQPGDSSVGVNFISEKLSGKEYSVLLQGVPGISSEIKIFTRQKPTHILGGSLLKYENNILTISLLPSKKTEGQKYVDRNIVLSF